MTKLHAHLAERGCQMSELEDREKRNRMLSPAMRRKIAEAQRRRWLAIRRRVEKEVTPRIAAPAPISPLHHRVIRHLGRQPGKAEASFIRRLQKLFAAAQDRRLREVDLSELAGRSVYGDWRELNLWRNFPSDDFYFWLYVAWELRRRNWDYPEFMAGITDFELIEPEMKQWERDKAIERWKISFRLFEERAPVSEFGTLELRLAVGRDRAWLEWRCDGNGGFAVLKQAQASTMATQFEQGTLPIGPDSLPLWIAAYRPAQSRGWWSFPYASFAASPALGSLLRVRLAPERVVTVDGQPLARPAEPLRLILRSPENNDDDYQLTLVTSDGSPPPKILCVLAGQPTLFLTERAIFTGPPIEMLDQATSKQIPAPALESPGGLRFLHSLGVPIPQHLSARVRTVPVRVKLLCRLHRRGNGKEVISLQIVAKAPGMQSTRFTPGGWKEEWKYQARSKSEPADGLVIIHDVSAKRHFPRGIESLDLKWEQSSHEWTWRLTKGTPDQFVAWLESLPQDIEVLLDKELATLRDAPISGEVSIDVAEAGIDWFDLKVKLKVSDTTLTAEELNLLLNARGGYVRMEKRGWRRLGFQVTPDDDEQLARLGLNARDLTAEPQRFHALQLADAAAKRFLAPERVEAIERRASQLKLRVTPPLSPAICAEMRPYQMAGLYFLAYLTTNHFGGVLADDMGLGKTLQTLAWLAWLRETTSNAQSPGLPASLVVCPKSVMDNWRTEAECFYPSLRVRLWRGEPVSELPTAREHSDLIVINYTQLRSLSSAVSNLPWMAAILDEAQYIKNPNSQTAQAARSLKAEHRLALTGTPIENRLLDLWSIFAFVMPGVLGNRAQFLRRFDSKDDPLARRRLAACVRPFLLRRTKAQVERDLPDRVEEDLLCEMEGAQKTLYSAELKRARNLVLGLKTPDELSHERFNILNSLLRLRQICCHPGLVDVSLRHAEAPKVLALEDLIGPLIEEGHKTLVFSQFVTMLDLLRDKAKKQDWPHFYLAGDTENRGELVREFQGAMGGAIFFISLRAGGFGLNLTSASYVILFDPWWNPAIENQAIDRTHRIGQRSKVIAYRLLMRDSIEQKVRELQRRKAAVAEDVLSEERFAQSLTLDDLRFLFAEDLREVRRVTT
jgi:SNF2-related domain/Helicase conserved C-terminal domain